MSGMNFNMRGGPGRAAVLVLGVAAVGALYAALKPYFKKVGEDLRDLGDKIVKDAEASRTADIVETPAEPEASKEGMVKSTTKKASSASTASPAGKEEVKA